MNSCNKSVFRMSSLKYYFTMMWVHNKCINNKIIDNLCSLNVNVFLTKQIQFNFKQFNELIFNGDFKKNFQSFCSWKFRTDYYMGVPFKIYLAADTFLRKFSYYTVNLIFISNSNLFFQIGCNQKCIKVWQTLKGGNFL